MHVRVLGGLEVSDAGGAPVDLGGRQPRVLLAMLVAAAGRPVTPDALAEAIWGDEPPVSATGTLQSYVSRLRRRFAGLPVELVWDESGYRLAVAPEDVDFRRFEALADQGRAHLEAGRPDAARAALGEALALWRGPALGELADLHGLRGLAVRLEERRLTALEDRATADLALGRHAAVAGELSELVAAHPLRERLQELLALALYRAGRQADALRALADAGRTLREELGIEPSRPLRDLETAILAHDPALDAPVPGGPAAGGQGPGGAPAPAPEAGTAGRAAAGAGPGGLVGRDEELAALVAALDESAHDARFVVVEGEPGIGKTRLVEELRARAQARGALAVWGRCDEGGAAPALWPWLPPLRSVVQRAGDDPTAAALAPPVAELLASEAAEPGGAGASHASAPMERFEAVGDLVGAVAGRAPVVVLLDDLQWADEASLELLGFLAGRAGPGLLVVTTVRRLEVGRRDLLTDTLATLARRVGSRRLLLRGLTEAETAAVLSATGAQPVDRRTAAVIHARAEGNPFYAIELARLLGQEGAPGDIPGSVADVVRRRLGHLPDATVELLGVGAVVGRDVELGLLARAALLDPDHCLDTIEPAVVHRLLVAVPELPSVLRFSHALVREALLDDLSALRRARLHLRVADAMEAAGAGVDDAEILAEHLYQAASVGGAGRAADALERAAEVAVRRVAYGAAEDLLMRAVQLRRVTAASPEAEDAELSAILRLVEVARARRYYAGAAELDVIDRAKELAERRGHRDVLIDMIWLEHAVAATMCELDLANRLSRKLLALTGDDPDPLQRAKATLTWGVHCWQVGRETESLEHLENALRLHAASERPPTTDLQREQHVLVPVFHLFVAAITGAMAPEEALAGYERMAESMTDRFVLASILGFESSAAVALGRFDVVERLVERSREVDPGTQFAFWTSLRTMHGAVAMAWRGKVDEALADFAGARPLFTGIGCHSTLAGVEASLALQVALAGRAEEAAAVAASARQELEAHGDRWSEPIVLMAEAAVAAGLGRRDDAGRLAGEARATALAQGSHHLAARAEALAAELGPA